MTPRARFNTSSDSAAPPRRGRRATRSRATAQNTDHVGSSQPPATSPQVPGIRTGFFAGIEPQPSSPLPERNNATAANSPQLLGLFNGLFSGMQPQPLSPLPGSSNTTAANSNPLRPSFDGHDNTVPNTSGTNTTNLAGGALTPALVPFGLGLGFASNGPPFDPRHNATMEELEEDMLRYPGTSREWLDNRATYFSDEVRKARKAGRRGTAKDLVTSAQELEDPNDRYAGSVYVDDPDRLEAGRRGQVKGFVDPYLHFPQQGQEDPERRHTGSLNVNGPDRLVDLAFNRPQRGREARRSGTEIHEDARENFINPYLSILEPGEQHPHPGVAPYSDDLVDVALNRPQRGRETRTSTEIPAPEITHDDDYEYVRRSHHRRRQRSPSPSPSVSSSSSITSSSPSVPSSDERYEEVLQNLNALRRIFAKQLSVPLTRLDRSDARSLTLESYVTVARLAMGGGWAKYIYFGADFMRRTGFRPPGFIVSAESGHVFEELLDASNLTRSERVDLELAVEDLKEMLGEQ